MYFRCRHCIRPTHTRCVFEREKGAMIESVMCWGKVDVVSGFNVASVPLCWPRHVYDVCLSLVFPGQFQSRKKRRGFPSCWLIAISYRERGKNDYLSVSFTPPRIIWGGLSRSGISYSSWVCFECNTPVMLHKQQATSL